MIYLNLFLQQSSNDGGLLAAIFGSFGGVIGYIYYAVCVMIIAQKTGTANAWLAWVPIVNIFYPFAIAQKSVCLYMLISLIPIVNFFILWDVWGSIAEQLRQNKMLWGCLFLIPPLTVIVPGYLAFFGSD
jgi:hypothetical protein